MYEDRGQASTILGAHSTNEGIENTGTLCSMLCTTTQAATSVYENKGTILHAMYAGTGRAATTAHSTNEGIENASTL